MAIKWLPIELLNEDDYDKPVIAYFGPDSYEMGKFTIDSEYGLCFSTTDSYLEVEIITHYSLLNNPE